MKTKYAVIDINTNEAMHTFSNPLKAHEVAADMNAPHLDKMYVVREIKQSPGIPMRNMRDFDKL